MQRRATLCTGATALLVLDLALPRHGFGLPMLAFGALIVGAAQTSIRTHQPASKAPWYLLAFTTALACVAIAAQSMSGENGTRLPLGSNLLILAGLACWATAIAMFVRARTRVLDRYQLLDLGIFVLSVTVAVKRIALDPMLESHPRPDMSVNLSMGFLLMELVIMVLLLRFATLPGRRPKALWFLLASQGVTLVGSTPNGVLAPETSLHLSLFAAGLFTMLACIQPSMRDMTTPSAGQAPTFGVVRATCLGLALVLSPVTAAVVHARTDDLELGWLLGPTFVLTALVIARLRMTFARERLAQAEVDASRAAFQALIHGINDVILVVQDDGVVGYASASSEQGLGLEPQELVDRRLQDLVVDADREVALRVVGTTHGSGATAAVALRFSVDGVVRTFDAELADRAHDPNVHGLVVVLHDVTERNRLEEQLRHQAMHDALTGLPNRALLADHLARIIQDDVRLGVLFVDLDDFKAVNDALGHEVGDRLLCAVADRLRSAVRVGDLVTRLGGDEFAVIVAAERTGDIGRRLLESLVEPFDLSGHRITVGASIGVTSVGDTPDELLRNADMAMYRAKADGKGSLAFFERSMGERASERLLVQVELAGAVAAGQLRLLYQPVYQLAGGRLVGAEALLRWEHPTRGLLGPDTFIPVAEETGLIVGMGEWVLAEACRQAATWPEDVDIAVNLSARQLESEAVVDHVVAALDASGIEPRRLVLEITETMLSRDLDATARRLARLRALGIRIAIDDFGTGYSSLSTLSRFPVDVLKIDRSFIGEMLSSPEASSLVHVLIEMGRAMHLDVIAEGIEDLDQAESLRLQLCDQGQGFYFSRPIDGTTFARLLADRATADLTA